MKDTEGTFSHEVSSLLEIKRGKIQMLTAKEHRERAVTLARQTMTALDATEAARLRRAAAGHIIQAQALEKDSAPLSPD
jgi:hypothetical protein